MNSTNVRVALLVTMIAAFASGCTKYQVRAIQEITIAKNQLYVGYRETGSADVNVIRCDINTANGVVKDCKKIAVKFADNK